MTAATSSDRPFDDLLVGYLDDGLSDSEQADMIARLGRDPRHLREFVDAVLFEDQLRTAVSVADQHGSVADFTGRPAIDMAARRLRGSSTKWHPVAVAISSLALGLAGASAVFGYISPSLPKTIFSLQEGFEHGPAPLSQGPPRMPGVWSGDYGEVIGRDRGVMPAEGLAMYRFLRSDFEGKPNPGQSFFSDLFKIIDLRPILAEGGEGPAKVQASAAFNTPSEASRLLGGSVAVFAISAETLAGGLHYDTGMLADRAVAMSRQVKARLDSSPASWERVRAELELPEDADFLVIHLGATVDHSNGPFLEFADHFVDDIQVEIVRTGVGARRRLFDRQRPAR